MSERDLIMSILFLLLAAVPMLLGRGHSPAAEPLPVAFVSAGVAGESLAPPRPPIGPPAGNAMPAYRLHPDTTDRARGIEAVRRARTLAESGDSDAAMEEFDRAADLLPELHDWLAIFAAEAAASAGDTAAMRRRLAATDADIRHDRGWRIEVRGFREVDDLAAAERVALAAAAEQSGAGDRASALSEAGRLRLERGDSAGAREVFGRAMRLAPGSGAAVDAARALSEFPNLGPEDHLRIGRIYLRHGNMARAIAGIGAYLESGGGTTAEREELRLELGRAHFRAGEYDRAEDSLLELADQASSASIAANALYDAGRAQYRRGDTEHGQETLLSISRRFPGEEAAARGLYLVADLDHDAKRIADARRGYLGTVAARPGLYESGLAMMRLAGLAFLAGEYRDALGVYRDYLRRFPDGRRNEQARYWSARAHLELGEDSLARERLRELRNADPFSFYGLRAGDLLGESFGTLSLGPSPSPDTAARDRVQAAMDRLDLLRDLDRDDAVAYEAERVKQRFAGDGTPALYEVAEGLNDRGFTISGINMGWDLKRGESWNPRLLRIVYPFPYRELVVSEARAKGLDPYLVAGLIRRESLFKRTIRSPVGATGLMQIMPETGEMLARQLGISGFQTEMLEDPEINVRMGTTYLRDLIGRFDGNLTAVLASYNAGPHRVDRWMEFPEFRDQELFGERIPYAETRDYVKIVQAHALIYRELYGSDAS